MQQLDVILKELAVQEGGLISKIEIYIDDTLKKTCNSSPCSVENLKYSQKGTHTYYVTAEDNSQSKNQAKDPTSGTNSFVISDTCGNDKIDTDAGEQWDGSDLLNGKTCNDFEFNSGTLLCAQGCQDYDLSRCKNVNIQISGPDDIIKTETGIFTASGGTDYIWNILDNENECQGISQQQPSSYGVKGLKAGICKLKLTDTPSSATTEKIINILPKCEDGIIDEGDEECEPTISITKTCKEFDSSFLGGTLSCTSTCQFNTDNCIASVDLPKP